MEKLYFIRNKIMLFLIAGFKKLIIKRKSIENLQISQISVSKAIFSENLVFLNFFLSKSRYLPRNVNY